MIRADVRRALKEALAYEARMMGHLNALRSIAESKQDERMTEAVGDARFELVALTSFLRRAESYLGAAAVCGYIQEPKVRADDLELHPVNLDGGAGTPSLPTIDRKSLAAGEREEDAKE